MIDDFDAISLYPEITNIEIINDFDILDLYPF